MNGDITVKSEKGAKVLYGCDIYQKDFTYPQELVFATYHIKSYVTKAYMFVNLLNLPCQALHTWPVPFHLVNLVVFITCNTLLNLQIKNEKRSY